MWHMLRRRFCSHEYTAANADFAVKVWGRRAEHLKGDKEPFFLGCVLKPRLSQAVCRKVYNIYIALYSC